VYSAPIFFREEFDGPVDNFRIMSKRIVIIGCGFGGLATYHSLHSLTIDK